MHKGLIEEDGCADEKHWSFDVENGRLCIHLYNDALTAISTLEIERKGMRVTAVIVNGVEYAPRS